MLYDVVLLATASDGMTLTGFERLAVAPVFETRYFMQTWRLNCVQIDKLIRAERKINELSGRLYDLTSKSAR
jgi:hypothetical protein